MKINPLTAALTAFTGLVVIAGGLLAAQPEPRAHIVAGEDAAGGGAASTEGQSLAPPAKVAVADIDPAFAGARALPGAGERLPLTAAAVDAALGVRPAAAAAPPAAAAAAAPAPAAPLAAAAGAAAVVPAAAHPGAARDERFVIKRILPIEGPIKYGEWHWDEAGVPPGPLVITVDLQARVISIWRGGYEIGTAAVLLGTQEKPTPTGVFPILMKDKNHFSATYDHAPMPYTMRLTRDGVSIHGTKVEWGYASHGCVGVPDAFAAKIFAIAKVGDKVYITRGKMVGKGDSLIG